LLKQHFELLCESLSLGTPLSRSIEGFFLSVFYPASAEHKDQILQSISQLQLPSHSLTHASLQTEKGLALGFILKTAMPGVKEQFLTKISESGLCALHH
jgi:hypothetical protein